MIADWLEKLTDNRRTWGFGLCFLYLRTAKATLQGIEVLRTIKNQHIHNPQPGIQGEIDFVKNLFKTVV